MSRTGRPIKWLRLILLAGAGVTVVVGLTLWIMFQHIPAWYRPPAIIPSDQRWKNDWLGARNRLQATLLNEKQDFEFMFSQDQINAWLAIREAMWPLSRNWLPAALSEPFVFIDSDGLRLAATYRGGGVRTIVSARLLVTVQGGTIRVALAELAGGSLGIPKSWVQERLALLDGHAWPAGKKSRFQLGGPPLPRLAELTEGVKLPDSWVWEESGLYLPFRIKKLRLESGRLFVTFQPLSR